MAFPTTKIGIARLRFSLITKQSQTFSTISIEPRFSHQSQYRKQISIANLLQRYGFPSSQLHNLLSKNWFLLQSDLTEMEKSLGILLNFEIPQKEIISLVFDCPGVLDYGFLKKWEVGILQLGISSVSPLMIRRVLEHSRKFELDPCAVFKGVEVLRGLGFCDATVRRVLEGFPGVVLMNEREIRRRIEFLMGISIPSEEIDWILRSFPSVLGFGIEGRLKPLLFEFKDLGFDENLIRSEVVREPRILGLELGELSRCLELLRTLKCREAIKEEIFSDGEFRAGFEVKLRVDYLCSKGLIRREAFEVLWKEPRSIIYNIDDIEKKVEFLVNRMKFNIRCLVEAPEYLGVNLDKQIVPRFNVIEYLRSKGALGFQVRLRDLIKPSRLKFYNLYVKPYPECEKMYGRHSGDVVVKTRHPVGLWKLFKPQSPPDSKQDVENMKLFVESLV
ncbi:hypothetical protein UlMin_008430 [Ulmus minor]